MQLKSKIIVTMAALLLVVAAVASAGPLLLVVNRGDNNLQVFDATTLDSLVTIPAGEAPHEVVTSPDGRFAYVSSYRGRDNTVAIIDIAARKRIGSVSTSPYSVPHGLAINSDGSRLYVTAEQRRCVVEIDLVSRKVTRVFKTDMHTTHICAISSDDAVLVASSTKAGNVTLFDLSTGELRRHIIAGGGVEGIDFSPDNGFLWTANPEANTVSVLDMAAGKRVEVIQRPGYPMRIKLTPDGKEAWVTCGTFGKVAVFDTGSRTQIAEIRVGNVPIGIAMDTEGRRVYVTNQDDNNVVMIDRVEKKVLRKVDAGSRPEGIVWVR